MSTRSSSDVIVRQVEELSGQTVADCYQCGCCTAGCPIGPAMDPPPSKAIRLLQLGRAHELLESDGIWLCASCMVCGTRCPRGVDYALIAEACRAIKLRMPAAAGRPRPPGRVGPETVTAGECEEIPQQAFMASFRKFSA